jgi:hypothetical protein
MFRRTPDTRRILTTMSPSSIRRSAAAALLLTAVAGCGSSAPSHSTTAGTPAPSPATSSAVSQSSSSATSSAPGALSADARSAATGDIPDNQVFLTFTSRSGGYAIKYPEGWTQSGSAGSATFRDKNNLVHVVVTRGGAATPAQVTTQLHQLARSQPSLHFASPHTVRVSAGPAVHVTYSTQSAPNQVTGKRVTLLVDRYELASGGRVAVIDLGTPRGVDNVDAYRMIINSFRWQ